MSRRLLGRLRPLLCSGQICGFSLKPFVSSYSCSRPSAHGFSHKPHGFFPPFSLSFASSGASNSNVVTVGSPDELRSLLKKTQEEKLPSIFYFYNNPCGDCEKCRVCAVHPAIEKLSAKYPNVKIYKYDIYKFDEEQEGTESIIKEQRIYNMPVFRFHKNGKKVAQVVGIAVIDCVESTMEKFYK